MSTRRSPSESATLFKVGTKKKGLDNNIWIIKETVNKTKRWTKFNKRSSKKSINTSKPNEEIKLIKPKGKIYFTHDNHERPFQVIVDKNKVYVYKLSYEENNKNDEIIKSYDKLIRIFTSIKIHIGKYSYNQKKYKGISFLLEMPNNKLIFIGNSIFEFELVPGDTIIKFFSKIGNSDFPYPVLLGKNNFYSMIEKQYCSRNEFPHNYKISDYEDAHTYFYGSFTKKGWISPIKEIKKIPKLKMIHKRLW